MTSRRPSHGCRALTALRIAFPREVCYTRHLEPPLPCLPVSSTMTMSSPDQVVTAINQVQNAVEVISTSHKQSQESWTTTQDALNHLVALVQKCSARDFEKDSELHHPLSKLQSDLETAREECRRYSAKKKGVRRRVSGVLPKWMAGKFLHREFTRLRERIQLIHNNFETAISRVEKQRDQKPSAAGPSGLSGPLIQRTASPFNTGSSKQSGSTQRNIGRADSPKVSAPSSAGSSSIPASGVADSHLEPEEWVMEDPGDWAVILTEMRNNVQSRATSLQGHVNHGLGDHYTPNNSQSSKQSNSKGVYPSTHSNLTLELRRLENHLLMKLASFNPPDLCPPHEYFKAVKLTPSYPIVLSGYSWELAIRHVTDLFHAVDVSSMEMGSPEAASTLFDLSQTLEDLCMHHYSHTVATWALLLRRGLYNSDKDLHRRDLASAHCLKARVLARLGRTSGALTAVGGAVQLCYEDEALQGVQLAKALHIQAPLLYAAGRKSEAKVAAREMVSILGALDDKPHLRHFLSLARASLSDLLLDMEEYQEALAVAEDAIKSARALIGVVDSRSALSIALLIKARILAGRENGSAYVAAVQAVRHLRDLTSERPAFTTFLAHALALSSRYLYAAGFYWEARKNAEEAVELHRTLHTSAPQAFAPHYAEAVGRLVQLRTADESSEAEVFDMAQHAAGLFREAAIHDSDALAAVLVVIANSLFEAMRPQEAVSPAEEAVGILRPRWKQNAEDYAPRFVDVLRLAAACRPSTEAGLELAKEAVEVHRPRKDLERSAHSRVLTHLLMDVFSRLRALDREAEAIPFKTEAARLNPDVVERIDPPPAAGAAEYSKAVPGGYGSESEDEEVDI